MTTLTHGTFGQGTLISEENGNVTIDFDGTIKTLVIAFARLKNEDGSAYGVTFEANTKKATNKRKSSNFMTNEEYANSKYSTMSKSDFEEERKRNAWGSKSF
jgi:hypothetical protein